MRTNAQCFITQYLLHNTTVKHWVTAYEGIDYLISGPLTEVIQTMTQNGVRGSRWGPIYAVFRFRTDVTTFASLSTFGFYIWVWLSLQELLQNADDAGATEIIFLYDKTQYPTKKIWSESLKDHNGPSIFVYNDATFHKQDWESIQSPQRSGKREDRSKIGRFGMGFVSVYHLTGKQSRLLIFVGWEEQWEFFVVHPFLYFCTRKFL